MKLGRFTIEQLSEGQFQFLADGSIHRRPLPDTGSVKKLLQEKTSSQKGINPLYLTDGTHHILIDTGLGWGLDAGTPDSDVSNACTNLAIFDVKPSDITHVILTHLHYDHCAASTYTAPKGQTRPTFPNAKYMVQQTEWDFALQQVQHQTPHSKFYKLDDLYRLYADNFFHFMDTNETEIIPGLTLIKTGGHTPGHQTVKIRDQGYTAYFMGDLLPTEKQLNYFDIANLDMNRLQAKAMKMKLLKEAYQEKAFLFFYHSIHSKTGQLEVDEDRNYVLKER